MRYEKSLWSASYVPSSPMLRGLAGHVRLVQLSQVQSRLPNQTCSVLPWPRSQVRIADQKQFSTITRKKKEVR